MPPNSLTRFTRLHVSLSSVGPSLVHLRNVRYQAHDALFDQDDLEEARRWYASFDKDSLPKGQTSYSRSSGPGGQHVNKTESKAISVWPVGELSRSLPKLLRPALKSSRYYTVRSDSITIQAQTQRSRSANTEDNHQKLVDELHRLYREQVPSSTSETKIKKHEEACVIPFSDPFAYWFAFSLLVRKTYTDTLYREKAFNRNRLKAKKHQTAKKASRKGGGQYE
ncbi:hypothetical protein F5Y03DRAFT_401171 [Xylaria venustula]|nr:hypothetical protein F5Y03DRAFT_401171 [Xylaria venustula]